MKAMRWLFPQPNAAEGLAARILWNRGVRTAADVERFMHPDLAHLHDPHALADMERAADRIAQAISAKEKILLYGDYDVDGTSAIVILLSGLKLAGAEADFHVPHRLREGYGMRSEIVEQAQQRGVTLIISVDTGIRAGDVVREANTRGIDVIITDHHLPESELPPAYAVVNPNRADCTYPAKNLCGAAVAWKLMQAVYTRLEWEPARQRKLMESFLKLVAIATVADVVPLTGENRVIVRHGLAGLRSPRNPGLQALLEVAGVKQGEMPSARQVAFQIAPRLNAAGRMDDARSVVEMFLTSDPAKARELALSLDSLNQERRTAEAEICELILAECRKTAVTDADAALVFCGAGWHRGVVGIVAGRLAEIYSRPVFVLSEDVENGEAHGSGRSPGVFHLLEALEAMPELFQRFGGHRQAAGLKMKRENLPAFRQRFLAYAVSRLTPEDFVPCIEIDAAAELKEIDEIVAMEVLSLAPFGAGNQPPVIALMRAELTHAPEIKSEKHLFLRVRQNGTTRTVKGWNMADRAVALKAGDVVDVAVTIEEDAWSRDRGGSCWALLLKDVRPAVLQ